MYSEEIVFGAKLDTNPVYLFNHSINLTIQHYDHSSNNINTNN